MIKIKELSKIYQGDAYKTVALDKVSFNIQDGEFLVISGASGSGKTTLLNILGGMGRASEGEVYYDDVNILELTQKQLDRFRKEHIGFIFQHFALMDKYTVYENLEAPLLARNVRKKERKKDIMSIASLLGIEDILYKYPTQVSGGQKQRVAIGRTLMVDCQVIYADEPTGALDEENTKNVMDILKYINNKGRTVVVITHDNKVAEYADRVLTLCDGRIENIIANVHND